MSLLLPTRYPARLYSSSDSDAPQITNADGAIKTILKACLVTGYGDRASAGWITLFDDGNQMVLRLPDAVQAIGCPDLKVENGDGKYRIVSQNNPTGLDDATEIASVPLLSRSSYLLPEWHLIATDIGFVFYYKMGEEGYTFESSQLGHILTVGLLSAADATYSSVFAANYMTVISATTGKSSPWMSGFLDSRNIVKNLLNNQDLTNKSYLDFGVNNADIDVCSRITVGAYCTNLFASLFSDVKQDNAVIAINNRQFLRVANNSYQASYGNRNIYIPVDYWEL